MTPWDESVDPIEVTELGGGLEASSSDMMGVDVKKETAEMLAAHLRERVRESYDSIVTDLKKDGEEQEEGEENAEQTVGQRVTLTLNTATRMLGGMVEFQHVVSVCVPPSYRAMGLYLDAFEQQLQPQV